MPISPYTVAQPIQFEYKPLGLEAFAKPLEKMQEGYDKALSDANELESTIDALNFGPDKEAAKKLQGEIESFREKIIDDLYNKRNYRSAQQWVNKANKWYKEEPHRLALAANKKALQEQEAEWEKGVKEGIYRPEYAKLMKLKAREDFAKEGTAFKGPNDYRSYSADILLKDTSEERKKEGIELAKATPEEIRQRLGSYHGMTISDRKFEAISTLHKYKDPAKMQAYIMEILKESPKYADQAKQEAGLDYYALTKKAGYENILKEELGRGYKELALDISRIDAQTKSKNKKEREEALAAQQSEGYKKSVEKLQEWDTALQQGTFIEPASELFQKRKFDEKFNIVSPISKLFGFDQITQERNVQTISDKEFDYKHGIGEYAPTVNGLSLDTSNTQAEITPEGFSTKFNAYVDQGKNVAAKLPNSTILTPEGREYKVNNHTVRKQGGLYQYKKPDGSWANISKDRQEKYKELVENEASKNLNIRSSRLNGLYVKLADNLEDRNAFIKNAKANYKDISEKDLGDFYDSYHKPENFQQLGNQVSTLKSAARNYSTDKAYKEELDKKWLNNSENKILSETLAVKKANYAKKIQELKAQGYDEKYIKEIFPKNDGYQYLVEIKGIENKINNSKQSYYRTSKNEQLYDVNEAKVGGPMQKKLETVLTDASELTSYTPVGTGMWTNNNFPGIIDEDGKLLPGVKVNPKSTTLTYNKATREFYLKTTVTDKDGKENVILLEPKVGTARTRTNAYYQTVESLQSSNNPDVRKAAKYAIFDATFNPVTHEYDTKANMPGEKPFVSVADNNRNLVFEIYSPTKSNSKLENSYKVRAKDLTTGKTVMTIADAKGKSTFSDFDEAYSTMVDKF